MKKAAIAFSVIMASAAIVLAGDMEDKRDSASKGLSTLQLSFDELVKAPSHGGPGFGHIQPQPSFHGQPGGHNNHGNNGWDHNGPGHHDQPGHHDNHGPQPGPWHPGPQPGPWHPGPQPGPWHPGPHPDPWHPYPPIPPVPHYQTVRFESGMFDWSNDAMNSYNDAVRSVERAGCRIMEKWLNSNSYRIVFESRRDVYVQRYDSMYFYNTFDAKRSADEMVRSYEMNGMVILEKNVKNNTFTISYFSPR